MQIYHLLQRDRSIPLSNHFWVLTAFFLLLTRSSVPQAKICDFGLARKIPDKAMTVDRELYVLHEKSSHQ
jgi:hypothetical protein